RTSLQATVPLAAYHTDKTWPEVVSPSLLIGAEKDTVAPVGTHSEPFYESLPGTLQKAYAELNEAGHNTTNSDNAPTSRLSVSWLKRFVDNDTRYSQFLCPPPVTPAGSVSSCGAASPSSWREASDRGVAGGGVSPSSLMRALIAAGLDRSYAALTEPHDLAAELSELRRSVERLARRLDPGEAPDSE
ncbi:MAG: hypothetical protein KY392_06565, partial [Chloroflexi bacterium]|nr:hypothetical protein [Chloroflexota bacterium]